MLKSALIAAVFASATFANSAHAGLIDVKSILLTNALGEALQVAEFQAFQSVTGLNVALASAGAMASTTSGTWDGNSLPGKAIDGAFSNLSFPNMYHNAGSTVGNLTITLAAATNLDSFTIYGRSDCCSHRDIYNVSFFGATGNLLYKTTADATNGAHMANVQLPPTDVPEPASIALIGLGLLGLSRFRKVKQNHA